MQPMQMAHDNRQALAGIVHCGLCESPMVRTGTDYTCPTTLEKNTRHHNTIDADGLLKAVLDHVMKLVMTERTVSSVVKDVQKESAEAARRQRQQLKQTELALGLARRFQKTGQGERPGGVFYTTFEVAHPAGLERVIHEIGTAVVGLNFADMSAERQRGWVVEYLKEQPSLLIWDGVENIAGFPEGSPGLLEEAEQAELDAFLSEVTGPGASWALLASRSPSESWLTCPSTRYQLNGLIQHDRRDLAAAVLEKSGVESGRVGADTLDLLDAVEGHPLASAGARP